MYKLFFEIKSEDGLKQYGKKERKISLLLYRLLEKKINGSYTCEQILSTLRSMNMTLLSQSSGYVPSYKRTDLTDELHRAFGFRTDYEYLSKVAMRNIVKESKEIKETKK